MEDLTVLVQSCKESFKAILASPGIRLYDDELYDELLMQWLRVRLWGDSVGLAFTQSINDLTILLTEIEITLASQSQNPQGLKSDALLQRNSTRQNSELLVYRSSGCSLYKTIENVRKMKIIIDDLELNFRSLNLSRPNLLQSCCRDSNPTGKIFQKPNKQTSSQETDPALSPADEEDAEISGQLLAMREFLAKSVNNVLGKPNMKARKELVQISENQLRELRVDVFDEITRRQQKPSIPYLVAHATFEMKRNKARKKLSFLPSSQLENLTRDTLTEINRRHPELRVFFKQEVCENEHEAIEKFSSFQANTSGEYEKLKSQGQKERMHFSCPRSPIPATRRYGYVLSPITPPPDLYLDTEKYQNSNKPKHIDFVAPLDIMTVQSDSKRCKNTTITHDKSNSEDISMIETQSIASTTTPHYSYCSHRISSKKETPRMFKSLNVSPTHQTRSILAATLREYQIEAPTSLYALCIRSGTGPNGIMEERRLGSNEYPLVIYQVLRDQGKDPFFLLRRLRNQNFMYSIPK